MTDSSEHKSKKALIIGINYLGTQSELGGCINDARNSKEMLLNNGYDAKDILMLNDDPDDKNASNPTVENIYKGINWLVENTQEGDQRFMHYSGHGSYIRDTSGDEADGRDECICPVDYASSGMILDDDLNDHLVDKLPYGSHLTILLDCCHSGSGMDLRYNYSLGDLRHDCSRYGCNESHRVNEKQHNSKCEVVMISGCRDVQTSADATIDNTRQGAMTFSFMLALKSSDRGLTYRELIQKMRKYLSRNRYDQVPQLSSGRPLCLCEKFPFDL